MSDIKLSSLHKFQTIRSLNLYNAFGKLDRHLWSQHGISIEMKFKIYNTCVLCSLLHTCETWVTYQRHMKRLKQFYQQCLHCILGIQRQVYLSNIDILECVQATSVETLVLQHWLWWSGHVICMKEGSLNSFYMNWLKKKKTITNRNWDIMIATRTHWRRPISFKLTGKTSILFILEKISAQCYERLWTEL